mgnify:CR=1 FL=1
MYIEGEMIYQFGSLYLTQKVYQLTDEEMEKFDLYHRTRVKLVKISGENSMDVMEFGISPADEL